MSDITVAPAGGAPPAAPNEVVVDTRQTTTPTPIGSQAPDKPAGDVDGSSHRPPSRREAIKAAFDRATKQQDEGAQRQPQRREQARERPAAAEAKPGHNRPPEPTREPQGERRATQAVQPGQRGQVGDGQPERQPQHREGGRFARSPEQQAQDQQRSQAGQQQLGQRRELPHDAPYREPLRRMSEHAKAEWANTPEHVRGAVHKLAQEFAQGYQRHKADIDAFAPVKRFHEMATQQGTTLEKALHNYVSMEQKLREDVVGGLDVIVRNLNLQDPETGRRLDVRDVAYHILNMSPDQHRLVQQQNVQTAANNQIGQLHQEIAGLKSTLQQMHTAQQFTQTRGAVDQFADTHPRFEELGDLIEAEIKLGFTLDEAYQRADLLRPSTHAAQTRTTSAQTRQVDRSISGAPESGAPNGATARTTRKGPPPSRRDAIQNAIRRVNGGF